MPKSQTVSGNMEVKCTATGGSKGNEEHLIRN